MELAPKEGFYELSIVWGYLISYFVWVICISYRHICVTEDDQKVKSKSGI